MKRFTLAVLVFTVLLVGYWAWPFVGLRAIAAALQAHNAAALSEQVDFPRLRSSLAQQIIFAYLRVTGRESKLGAFAPIASTVGASIADPLVSQIINPENLIELLRGGTIESERGRDLFPYWDISAFLPQRRMGCLVGKRIWAGPGFDWITSQCRGGRTISPSNAAITVALEDYRPRPAPEIARPARARAGKEISIKRDRG